MHYSASRPRSRADRNGVRWRGLKIQTDSVAGLNCKPFYMKHKRICVFVGSRCSSSRFNQQRPSRVSYTLSCSNANFIRSHVDVFKYILRTHDDLKTLDIDVVKKMNLPSKRPNEQVSDQPLLTTALKKWDSIFNMMNHLADETTNRATSWSYWNCVCVHLVMKSNIRSPFSSGFGLHL